MARLTYLTPDVYVEEIPGGPRPIEAVGTSTAGFVGQAPNPRAPVDRAVAISNWSQFLKVFVDGQTENTHLVQAVFGFFQNGGSRCHIANVGGIPEIAGLRKGLSLLEEVDEVAIVAAPGYTDAASYDEMVTHCEADTRQDRVAILDSPQNVTDIESLTKVATVKVPVGGKLDAGKSETGKSEPGKAEAGKKDKSEGLRPKPSDGGYAAFYFPWIVIRDPLSPDHIAIAPPSGHLAGIYARTDSTRGVHKAPANEQIRGALNVNYRVSQDEQAVLNPEGVNCIRLFSREGIRVWGARTIAASDSEWRYLNVRRLFIMIKESIARVHPEGHQRLPHAPLAPGRAHGCQPRGIVLRPVRRGDQHAGGDRRWPRRHHDRDRPGEARRVRDLPNWAERGQRGGRTGGDSRELGSTVKAKLE